MKKLIRNKQTIYFKRSLYNNIKYPYRYTIFAIYKELKCEIIISSTSVVVLWYKQGATFTNLTPANLFPDKLKLKKKDLIKILDILVSINFEGRHISEQHLNILYKEWKDQGCP